MNISQIIDFCRKNLDFSNIKPDEVYFYYSLPLCVIDAVFSIGVSYRSTELTVQRFCDHFSLPVSRGKDIPPRKNQLSISTFLEIYDDIGTNDMADHVYQNRQRTSSRNGIPKSEAVLLFSQILAKHHVDYLQDIDKIMGLPTFEYAIQKIPGQNSGVSLRYFYMLVGNQDFIKPDRMIKRFLFAATGENLSDEDCQQALTEVCLNLQKDFPGLTPRTLDNLIWNYQRNFH